MLYKKLFAHLSQNLEAIESAERKAPKLLVALLSITNNTRQNLRKNVTFRRCLCIGKTKESKVSLLFHEAVTCHFLRCYVIHWIHYYLPVLQLFPTAQLVLWGLFRVFKCIWDKIAVSSSSVATSILTRPSASIYPRVVSF